MSKRPREEGSASEGVHSSDEEEDFHGKLVFDCRMECAKDLYSLLSCLSNFKGSKKDDYAMIEVILPRT
jgi:hypothetical protein